MNDLTTLKEELDAMDPSALAPSDPTVWVTRNRRRIKIRDMSTRHLINTLLYIKRSVRSELRSQILENRSRSPNSSARLLPINEVLDNNMNILGWRTKICTKWREKFRYLEQTAADRGFSDWESKKPNEIR